MYDNNNNNNNIEDTLLQPQHLSMIQTYISDMFPDESHLNLYSPSAP